MDFPISKGYEENFENDLMATPTEKGNCLKKQPAFVSAANLCHTQRQEFQEDYHQPRGLAKEALTTYASGNASKYNILLDCYIFLF